VIAMTKSCRTRARCSLGLRSRTYQWPSPTYRPTAGQTPMALLLNRPRSPETATSSVEGTDYIRTTQAVTRDEETIRNDILIKHRATQHGIRADLVRAVIQAESEFGPDTGY